MTEGFAETPTKAPLGLALHSSTSSLGLALGTERQSLRVQVRPMGRDMASGLHQAIAHLLPPQILAQPQLFGRGPRPR